MPRGHGCKTGASLKILTASIEFFSSLGKRELSMQRSRLPRSTRLGKNSRLALRSFKLTPGVATG